MNIKNITDEHRTEYKDLILRLREINPNQSFFMGIFHELESDDEKMQMLNWLRSTDNPTKNDAELKALEITEPRRTKLL